jgi:uncharacterized protein YggE
VIGCIGSYVISVRTSSIEEGSRVLEAVGGVGGDSLQVRGFHLFVSDPEPLRVVARRRAVEDALSRARQIADAAGVQMGGVLSIEEVSGFPRGGSGLRPLSGGAMLAAGGAPPVEPGSLSVDVSVTLTVEIAE